MALTMYDLAGASDDFRFSPYCWRVRMACAHKGLQLHTLPAVHGEGSSASAKFGDRTGTGRW
jgi:glutathione S-transferase